MVETEFKYYTTYYDIELVRTIISLLNSEKINFKYIDKSNQINYRMPQTTFVEIDIMLLENDFERVNKLIDDLDE